MNLTYSNMEILTADENALLITNERRKRMKCTKSKVFIFGLVAVVSFSLVAITFSCLDWPSPKCQLPIYDRNGVLLNSSVPCSEAMRNVLTSLYLPNADLYSDTLTGMQIWEPFPEHCFISKSLRKTKQTSDAFKNIDTFYRRISSDTGVSLNLVGKQTMGATLNVKTNSLSAGSTSVMGASVQIYTTTRSISLDPKCFKLSGAGQLIREIITDFDALPTFIPDPSYTESWQPYSIFLKKYGTHFTNQVIMGSSLRQWTFAKSSEQYTMESLKVKACVDLFGVVSGVPMEFNSCSKVMKESETVSLHMATSSSLEIKGCTDETRNKLMLNRSPDLIRQLLDEGSLEYPMAYKYIPIWDIFLMKYGGDKNRYRIAMNMKQYYEGMLDFGCTLIEVGGIKARKFKYRNNDARLPIFQCELAKEGCNSDSDCHIGPSLSVTYCYGSTCLEHADPAFGSKAKTVFARKSQQGHYYGEVNDSCQYEIGVTAGCYNNAKTEIIWDGSAQYK